MEDKFTYHMSHPLSYEDRLQSRRYRWRLIPFKPKFMPDWFGTGKRRLTDVPSLQTRPYGIRERLYSHWLAMYESPGKTLASSRRLSFYNICNSYRDVLCPTNSEKSSFVDSYLIHLLNHSLKSIDQGFTRPKVLILVPVARDAHILVRRLSQLYTSENMGNVKGLEKFNTRIVEDPENDEFIFSIKLESETIRLYGAYNDSDIMVASPVGLVTKIWLAEKTTRRDVDAYLSSIELLVVDYSRRKDFKNWAYVVKIVEYLNSRPEMDETHLETHRPWHVDGEARFYRQTIILSYSVNQDVKDMFYRHCVNFEGKMEFSYFYSIPRRFPSFSPPLPLGHCIIAMSYPPGNRLMSFIRKAKVQNFRISPDFPRDFAVHGGWQTDEFNVKEMDDAEIQASEDWLRLLGLCMPNASERSVVMKNMTSELIEHGKYIDFLNESNYVQFVVGVFLRYRFDLLMAFLCRRVRLCLQPEDITTIHYLRHEWTGISLAHFTQFLREYDPIYGAELITKVFYHEGRFFFYELCTYVTKEGKLAQREGRGERGVTFDYNSTLPLSTLQVEVPPNAIVYFLSI